MGRAIYQLNRDDTNDPVMMTPELITLTRRQIWRHLLCGDCEQRFNTHGESLIMRLVQRKTDFALLDRLSLAIPFNVEPNALAFSGSAVGIDTEQLAYFALSVLWRSGVREWRTLGQQTTGISLGAFEEPIRKYLFGETPFPAGVAVNVWVCTDIGSRFNTFFPYAVDTAYAMHSLLVRGLWFHITTGSNLPTYIRELCCVSSARKVLFLRNSERELLQAASHMHSTAAVSPKLSALA